MSPWSTYPPKSCNPSVLPKLWMPWLMKLRSSGTKSHIICTDIPYFFEKDLKIAGVLVVCGTPVRVSDSTFQHICWQLHNPKASKTPHLILPWDSYSFLWNTLWGLVPEGNAMTRGHQVSPPVWPTAILRVWLRSIFDNNQCEAFSSQLYQLFGQHLKERIIKSPVWQEWTRQQLPDQKIRQANKQAGSQTGIQIPSVGANSSSSDFFPEISLFFFANEHNISLNCCPWTVNIPDVFLLAYICKHRAWFEIMSSTRTPTESKHIQPWYQQ